MAKIKKFDVLTVPIEVEYTNPIAGRLFGVFPWGYAGKGEEIQSYSERKAPFQLLSPDCSPLCEGRCW